MTVSYNRLYLKKSAVIQLISLTKLLNIYSVILNMFYQRIYTRQSLIETKAVNGGYISSGQFIAKGSINKL